MSSGTDCWISPEFYCFSSFHMKVHASNPILSVIFYLNFDSSYFKGPLLIFLFQLTLWQCSECSPSCHSKEHRIVSNVWVLFLAYSVKSKIPLCHIYRQCISKSNILWSKHVLLLSHKISIFDDWEAVTWGFYAHTFRRPANQVKDFAVWHFK